MGEVTGPDLAGRIADRLRTHQWYDNPAFPNLHEPSAHGTHEGVGFTTDCAVCMKRVDRIAAVAAQVAAEVVDEWERTAARLAEHVTDLTGQRNTLRIQLDRLQPLIAAAKAWAASEGIAEEDLAAAVAALPPALGSLPPRAQDEPDSDARRLLDQAIATALPLAGGRVVELLNALRCELARVDAKRVEREG